MSSSSGFPGRLKIAMNGRSIREFAASANMSAGTLHNYLNNESLPTLDKLVALARTASVNLNWLAMGDGPVQYSELASDTGGAGRYMLDVKLLKAALECTETAISELDIRMNTRKKSMIIASVYDLMSELGDQPENRDRVIRLIESTVA